MQAVTHVWVDLILNKKYYEQSLVLIYNYADEGPFEYSEGRGEGRGWGALMSIRFRIGRPKLCVTMRTIE